MPLIGNRVVEKDLRTHLSKIGYAGGSACFENLELVGIQRPGWIQVFSFTVTARQMDDDDATKLFGVCIDDERTKRFEVVLDADELVRDQQLGQWTQNLLTVRGGNNEKLPATFVCLFACLLAAVVIAAIAIQLTG